MRNAVHRSDPLAPYSATASAPWDLRRVVHLHRRAGFGATWLELERDLADGPEAAIDRILAGRSRASGVPADFDHISSLIADAAVQSGDLHRLQAWWVYRLLFSPDPLGERLTLLWHNHFATSNEKVHDLRAMRRQNETHRRLARARFGELLAAAIREPALLLYLDATANRKGRPNENLARELMELFTLGIGHYTESDVKAAARALTGWTFEDGELRESPAEHDDGEKTILGKTGRWSGSQLVAMLADQPATAHRLASRLCGLFMGEQAVDAPAVAALAVGLRDHHLDIGWGVETILRSRAFFASANIRTRVLGPAEFVIGACRTLLPLASAPEHALIGRLDPSARPGPLQPTQCRRLARGPRMVDRQVDHRADQVCVGARRWPIDRLAGPDRCIGDGQGTRSDDIVRRDRGCGIHALARLDPFAPGAPAAGTDDLGPNSRIAAPGRGIGRRLA